MDGSGRWAKRQGLARTEGHGAGEASLVDVTYGALAIGVKALTVFAFSTENWRRPVDEVRYLMNFNRGLLERRQHELNADGVRIVFSGRRDWRVPKGVLRRMDEAAALTEDNQALTLNIAFNYGGRAEIIDAVRALVEEKTPAKKIDEKAIRARLYHPRTSRSRSRRAQRRANIASRTSCFGRWPIPSSSSRTCTGPTFVARTCIGRLRSFKDANVDSAAWTSEGHSRHLDCRGAAVRRAVDSCVERREFLDRAIADPTYTRRDCGDGGGAVAFYGLVTTQAALSRS